MDYIWEPIERVMKLGEEERIEGVEFTVRRMTQRVAGIVLTPTGEPVVGRMVTVEGWGVHRYDYTDGQGRFSLENVAGDDLRLNVGRGAANEEKTGQAYLELTGIKAGQEDLEIILESPGKLAGAIELLPEQESLLTENGLDFVYVNVCGLEKKFFEIFPIKVETFELNLPPNTYRFEFYIHPSKKIPGRKRFDDIEVATGMETDLGVFQLEASTE